MWGPVGIVSYPTGRLSRALLPSKGAFAVFPCEVRKGPSLSGTTGVHSMASRATGSSTRLEVYVWSPLTVQVPLFVTLCVPLSNSRVRQQFASASSV